MELVRFGRLTEEFRRQLEGDEDDPFDAARVELQFRPKERHVGLRDEAGRVIASTGLVEAEVEVAGHRFPIVGIGGVIVNAGYRGRGLGRQIVDAALDEARALGPEFALLFCHEDRAGLYSRLGFSLVRSTVTVTQPAGPEPMTQLTMWRSLATDARWPPGEVVLLGLPF
jgi:predicted N-acetyltransferase YhbS